MRKSMHRRWRRVLAAGLTCSLMLGAIPAMASRTPAAEPGSDGPITALSVGGAHMAPAFDPSITTYFVTAPYAMPELSLTASAGEDTVLSIQSGGSSVYGEPDGQGGTTLSYRAPLPVGYSELKIQSMDENFEQTEYTFYLQRYPNPKTGRNEIYRPQFHYTPLLSRLGDPNGLVYNELTGEYHLFHQYDSHDRFTSWGHAVSTDLVHWEQWPLAIVPDEWGVTFSGSGVIDRYNTSGLFDESVPPESRMVILYTNYQGDEQYGREKQSLAYSKDNGLNWIKYDGNPVLRNGSNHQLEYPVDFRDPKVLWIDDPSYEKGGIWLMVLGGGQGRLFASENLIDWTHQSDMVNRNGNAIHSECPDLFPIDCEETGATKWVFMGAGQWYILGNLVKKNGVYEFQADSDQAQMIWEPTYASQTFYNEPQGRRIQLSWLRDFSSPKLTEDGIDKKWQGAVSMAQELRLERSTVNGRYYLSTYPIEEVESLRSEEPIFTVRDAVVNESSPNLLDGVQGSMYDITAEIDPGDAKEFGFRLRKENEEQVTVQYTVNTGTLTVDTRQERLGYTEEDIFLFGTGLVQYRSQLQSDGKVRLRILVDRGIVDAYANGGAASASMYYYPSMQNLDMEFFVTGGEATVSSLDIYFMESIWHGSDEPDWGDVNADGAVDASDALLALQSLVELRSLTDLEYGTAEVSGDHAVNASDALYILQKLVQLIDRFPVESA